MASLRKVVRKLGITDTDKDTDHSYFEVYEDLCANKKIRRVLEVGVMGGGSLRLWAGYFPKAQVFGIDIRHMSDYGDRIYTMTGDAYTSGALYSLLPFGPFDLIIDDGSHEPEHLKFFAKEYQALLADGGTMVIEDVPTSECAQDLLALLPESARIVDRRHIKQRFDDLLVIYEKPSEDAMM
jgi:predicted O-methyltransferase YrrM